MAAPRSVSIKTDEIGAKRLAAGGEEPRDQHAVPGGRPGLAGRLRQRRARPVEPRRGIRRDQDDGRERGGAVAGGAARP